MPMVSLEQALNLVPDGKLNNTITYFIDILQDTSYDRGIPLSG